MVGFLSKDFEVLKQVTDEALDHDIARDAALSSNYTGIRPTIIYPSHLFPVVDEAVNSMYEHVVSSLERMLQVERRVVNFTEEWARSRDNNNTEALEDYFAPVSIPGIPR